MKINKDKNIELGDNEYPIVNSDTGEVIDKFCVGDKITRNQQIEYTQEYDTSFGKGKTFMKIFDDQEDMLTTKLTSAEIAFVLKIRKYVSYNDAVLRDNYGKGEVLTYNTIADNLDISYSGARKLVESLMKKGVLAISKTGTRDNNNILIRTIHANPYIFIRGNKMSRVTSDLFRNSGW